MIKVCCFEIGKQRRLLRNQRCLALWLHFTRLSSTVDERMSFCQKKLLLQHQSSAKCNFYVNQVAFSTDNKTIALSLSNNTVQIWNYKTGKLKKLRIGWNFNLTLSPNGETLAFSSDDDSVRLWNVEKGELRHNLKGHNNSVNCVRFSPDGATLASCSSDTTVRLWNAATGELIKVLEGHSFGVRGFAFSPNGKALASYSFGNKLILSTFNLWNVETGQSMRLHNDHCPTRGVKLVAFSPNGKTLASFYEDENPRLWNVETGKLTRVIHQHNKFVIWAAFLQDGETLVWGSDSGTVNAWNVKTGERTRSQKQIQKSALSPDGKTIAHCAGKGRVELCHVWKPVQRMLQHYAVVLSKSCHLSSTTISMIFKSIINQQNLFALVSDDDILQFVNCLKCSHKKH